jgi:endonuclease/exonuclease/phosphatase (EEP) superfamily protein YafD
MAFLKKEGKQYNKVISSWQGPVIIGGDCNTVMCTANKSNGVINHK